eukprot:TRINITY_DN61479_c0_g1_i1.p1 TRINITY_DN61479_c0_g1~~TRINITY_DN61479_c0_g1_i1.p1  ORF type:complete len:357 (-),score=53.27 TRINITY_DN61479_c0_g1_i1:182-1252(-)
MHVSSSFGSGDGRASRSRSPSTHPYPKHCKDHTTVGGITAERTTVACYCSKTLGDACDAMIGSGRTAAVLLGDQGGVCGVLTENDILAAIACDAPADTRITHWLHGELARVPRAKLPSLTVPSHATLVQAARVMASEAATDPGHACHHLLVIDDTQEARLLSALDIVHGIVSATGDTSLLCQQACVKETRPDLQSSLAQWANTKVQQVMKPCSAVIQCQSTDSLLQAYRRMYEARQNCILVVDAMRDGEHSHPEDLQIHGRCHQNIITAGDALQSFSKYQHGHETIAEAWLRVLKDAEHAAEKVRSIHAEATLTEAAFVMTEIGVHHLVVTKHGQANTQIIGVLSVLDIARALGSD